MSSEATFQIEDNMVQESGKTNLAIVGINHETAGLLSSLLESDEVRILRILNPETENLSDLRRYRELDMVVNTTHLAETDRALRGLGLRNVDVIGSLSAKILFLSGRKGMSPGVESSDKNRVLESLREIRQAVLLSKNRDELLKLVLTVAMRSNDADSGSIMLLDAEKRFLKIEIANGISEDIVTSTVQKVGKGIAGKVVRTGKPILLNGSPSNGSKKSPERSDITSSICCPLIIDGESVGALSINSTRPGVVFSRNDLDYLSRLAGFTADVIRTSTQLEHGNFSSVSLSLMENARNILQLQYSFEERLNLLLLRVVNSLGGEICNYYSYNHELGTFYVKGSSSFEVAMLKGKVLKLNQYLAKRAVEAEGATAMSVVDDKSYRRRNKWYILQPLTIEENLVGLLFLHLVTDSDCVEEEKTLLGKLSDLIAAEMSHSHRENRFRSQSVKYSAISEASFDLAVGGTPKEMARVVVSNACLILEAEVAIFRIYERENEELVLLESCSLTGKERLREIERFDGRVAEHSFSKNDVVLLSEFEGTEFSSAPDVGIRTVMSMNLSREGARLGTLSLYNKMSLDFFGKAQFDKGDAEVFLNYCLQVAKAFRRMIPEMFQA